MRKDLNRNEVNKKSAINSDKLLEKIIPDQNVWEDDTLQKEAAIIDQLLKEGLQDEFSCEIPEDFADRVCDKIEKRSFLWEGIEKHLLMAIGFLGIPGIAIGLLYYLESNLFSPISQFLIDFKWPLLFGLFCIAAIQVADLYLVKSRQNLKE